MSAGSFSAGARLVLAILPVFVVLDFSESAEVQESTSTCECVGISLEMALGGVFLGVGVCLSSGVCACRTNWWWQGAYALAHLLVGHWKPDAPISREHQVSASSCY